jgi:hypothetical protein
MQNFWHYKCLYHIFSDLHRKVSKTLICNISLGKKTKTKKTCLSALKNVAMLGETNNQFYMALVTINLIGRFPPPSQYPIGKLFSENLSFPYHDMLNHI